MKKKYKIALILIIILIIIVTLFMTLKFFLKNEPAEPVKVVDSIENFSYTLDDRDTELMKNKKLNM